MSTNDETCKHDNTVIERVRGKQQAVYIDCGKVLGGSSNFYGDIITAVPEAFMKALENRRGGK